MSGARKPGGRTGNAPPGSYLGGILVLVLLRLASFGLSRVESAVPAAEGAPRRQSDGDRKAEHRRDLHAYLWGAGLSLSLTVLPFALVYWSVMSRSAVLLAIGVLALAQIVVHFRFFLHIDPPRQKTDDLYLILFSTLVLAVMASGTIWIMGDLARRMG